jgi:hypothetical protein
MPSKDHDNIDFFFEVLGAWVGIKLVFYAVEKAKLKSL